MRNIITVVTTLLIAAAAHPAHAQGSSFGEYPAPRTESAGWSLGGAVIGVVGAAAVIAMGTTTELLDDDDTRQKAIGTMALCIGGMAMARAVADRELSDEILLAARSFGGGVKHRSGQ